MLQFKICLEIEQELKQLYLNLFSKNQDTNCKLSPNIRLSLTEDCQMDIVNANTMYCKYPSTLVAVLTLGCQFG